MDSYTPGLSHQFHLFDHLGKLQWSSGQSERKGCELICLAVQKEPEVFPGSGMDGDVKVSVAEIQRRDPFPFLQGDPDGLRCFHLECVCFEKKIELTEIQDWTPLVVGFWDQEQAVVKG